MRRVSSDLQKPSRARLPVDRSNPRRRARTPLPGAQSGSDRCVRPARRPLLDRPATLTATEIRGLIEEVAASAVHLQDCGFSGVEISGGHGHLFHQFLSPHANRRDDEFGGDWDGRTRFVAEMVAALRTACGSGFIIGLKLPCDDGVAGSIRPPEAALVTDRLTAPGNIDYVCFAGGSHARTLEMHTPDRHGPPMPYMDIIKDLKRSANGVPVMALGRITDPAEADGILARDDAQLIALGRPLIADPAWPKKAKAGRSWDIRYCLSCNTCWGTIVTQQVPIACVNNPRIAQPDETDYWPEPVEHPKRVAVVGAGIAGMEAAWVAAARGHNVTVFGVSAKIGGKAWWRERLPGGRPSLRSMTIRRSPQSGAASASSSAKPCPSTSCSRTVPIA